MHTHQHCRAKSLALMDVSGAAASAPIAELGAHPLASPCINWILAQVSPSTFFVSRILTGANRLTITSCSSPLGAVKSVVLVVIIGIVRSLM
jgi:hypothetical protein